MMDYTCPMVSTLGILAPMDPSTMMNPIHYNSWVGPLVTSDWDAPVYTIGPSSPVSAPSMSGVPDAMMALDMVDFLFPV